MGEVTVAEICDAIAETLGAAASIKRTQSYDELTEGIHDGDCPLLQVYFEDMECDPYGETHMHSFGGSIKVKQFTINADLYAAKRKKIGQDMQAVVELVEELNDILEAENLSPFFIEGVKAFKWTVSRTTFRYGDRQADLFAGARFAITVYVF